MPANLTAQYLKAEEEYRRATTLDDELVQDTLNVILKYEADIRKAQQELSRMMTKPTAPAAPAPGAAPTAAAPPRKKGTLH